MVAQCCRTVFRQPCVVAVSAFRRSISVDGDGVDVHILLSLDLVDCGQDFLKFLRVVMIVGPQSDAVELKVDKRTPLNPADFAVVVSEERDFDP